MDGVLESLNFSRWPRLEAFSHFQVEDVHARLGSIPTGKWPELAGCFVILFTARTGSTFLCRELEHLFDIGKMGEFLNPAQLRGRPVSSIVERRVNSWFAFKAGAQGIISAELTGLFETYIDKSVFILLVRRDVVAQAVSLVKAAQTSQWHLYDQAERKPVYDEGAISRSIRKILARANELREYAELTGRPRVTLVYEDFANSDFNPAIAAAQSLGVPFRTSGEGDEHRPVERMSDSTNTEWQDRYTAKMSPTVRNRIEAYKASLIG